MAANKRLAVVTGGNRGIGFETARRLASEGMRVVLASRDPAKGEEAAGRLRAQGLDVEGATLDVADDESVRRFASRLKERHGRVDVLVNNAGIYLDGRRAGAETSILKADVDTVRRTLETNTFGPLRVIQALLPLMRKGGRIINVSSGMGQLSEMNGGWPAYRISKTALNAVTRIFSEELKDAGIQVNSICPGWVKTDMGGREAPRTTEQAADGIAWLATQPDDGPTGGFFRDKKPIDW